MGLPVLVLGFSGSGKSASMRNFKEDELALVNVNGKFLPFRTQFNLTINTDNCELIKEFIKNQNAKTVVVDDSQYIMANEFMRRAKETGYQKFTDIGRDFWELVKAVEALPNDVIVYFLHHAETDSDGRQKTKTIGKMLDEKISVEGMFTIVLKTVVEDGSYLFATQTDGNDVCKSPMGLFDEMYIPNDLKLVDEAIRTYYHLTPEHFCDDCGKTIMPAGNRSVTELVEGSMRKFGRKLCLECGKKEAKKLKNAETISE